MRIFGAAFAAALCLSVATGCGPSAPPSGRWQGAYESADVMVVTRLEIDSKGTVYLSAPDATDIGGASAEDRTAIKQRLTEGLSIAWAETEPRRLEFDGRVFRKPGGVAPQLEWDPDAKQMTAVVYLGMRDAIRVPLHPVKDFSANPWM